MDIQLMNPAIFLYHIILLGVLVYIIILLYSLYRAMDKLENKVISNHNKLTSLESRVSTIEDFKLSKLEFMITTPPPYQIGDTARFKGASGDARIVKVQPKLKSPEVEFGYDTISVWCWYVEYLENYQIKSKYIR